MSRIHKTLFSVICGRGLVMARQLLLVPVLIHAWGINYYGAWLMLSAIPSFLATSNLGLGTSAHMSIAVDIAAGRNQEAGRSLITSLWMILGIAMIVVFGTFAWMQWWHPHNAGAIEYPGLVVPLLLANLFVRMLVQPFYGYWAGIGKPSVANNFVNLVFIGELALYMTIPLLGGKALILTLLVFFWTLLYWVYVAWKTFRMLQQASLLPTSSSVDWKAGKKLLSIGLGHQLTPLWQAILFQGSLVLAGTILGPAGAALWGSLRIATRCGNQLLELVGQSLAPEFQIAFGAKDIEKVRKLHSVGLITSLFLSTPIAIALLILGPSLFRLWTHHAFVVPISVWWWMSLSLIPYSLWYLSGKFFESTNQPWQLNLLAVVSSILAVACMTAGIKIGLLAFAIGAFVFEISMVVLVLPKALSQTNDHLGSALRRGFKDCFSRIKDRQAAILFKS